MIDLILIWIAAGIFGVVSMSIQAKVRGHSFKDQLTRFLQPWWGIPLLILCGLITLAVSSEKLEQSKKADREHR